MRGVLSLSLLLMVTACGSVPPIHPPEQAPTPLSSLATGKNLVLVGGGLQDNNAAVYDKIVNLAGGRGVARIGVITAASVPESQDPNRGTATASNARANGLYYANLFKNSYGALDAQWIPIDLDTISNNSSATVVNQINSMSGFFFGGGDQSRLIQTLVLTSSSGTRSDSLVLAALRSRFSSGAVVSGSSAGTAIMAAVPMITGGESYDALNHGAFPSFSSTYPDDLSYDSKGGFALFNYGVLDTHFSERGRQGRIVRLASSRGASMAYAPDENTALVVTNADTGSASMGVLGTGGVSIFDLSSATVGTGTYWSISNVKMNYLTGGDSFTPSSKGVGIAACKTSLSGREQYSTARSPTRDIFSSANNVATTGGRKNPREFVNIAQDLFNSRSSSTTGQTYETGPVFEVKLSKVSGSVGYEGTCSGSSLRSFKGLSLNFYRY